MRFLSWPDRLERISKHRQFVYGFAALWVMLFHFSTRIPPMGILVPLRFIQDKGPGGVDIFVLLSGFGLYYSMKKSPTVLVFYKKRLLRVFLPSFIVMAFYNILVDESFVSYLANSTFLGYWFGYFAIWYIAFILTMYLIYPILYRMQNRNPKILYGILLCSLLLSYVCEHNWVDINILRGVSRIPIFIVGCILAPAFEKNRKIPAWVFPAALITSVLFTVFENIAWAERYYYFYHSFLYFSYSVALVLVMVFFAEWITRRKSMHWIYQFMAFCGMLSLEFYLLYERCCFVFDYLPGFESDPFSFIKVDLAAIVCTFVLSVVLQRLTKLLITAYESVIVPLPDTDKAMAEKK